MTKDVRKKIKTLQDNLVININGHNSRIKEEKKAIKEAKANIKRHKLLIKQLKIVNKLDVLELA